MGVLNLTPDSFSDGGRLDSVEAVLAQARRMLAQGAAVLDLGAQSTRPGATEVGPTEELRRLLPALRVLQQLRQEHPALLLSIDTFDASVAEAALAEGADWINDVRGANRTAEAPGGTLRDPAMLPLIARQGCPYVLMHSRGTSQSMDSLAAYGDVVAEVRAELQAATASALSAGVNPEQIIWDVGLGFAKTTAQNLELLRRLPELMETDGNSSGGRSSGGRSGYPLLVGPSRKRFIGAVLDEPRPRARLWGTAAVCTLAVAAGARVLRVHDVGPIAQTVRMATAISPR
ncbi:MAG: dihydropteroate synthase [Cyanobacteria bacterium REEB417]|nr:dihydropteroate synthase [Cyanobacteria bacterium REEB417]